MTIDVMFYCKVAVGLCIVGGLFLGVAGAFDDDDTAGWTTSWVTAVVAILWPLVVVVGVAFAVVLVTGWLGKRVCGILRDRLA